MLYIFADESGNFSGNRDHYFVLSAFVTSDPRATRKCFLRARQTRLPKKYRHYSEIKFSDRAIPERFKKHVLGRVAQEDVRIYAIFFDKRNLPLSLRRQPEGLVYCHLVGQLLEMCPLAESREIYIFLDRRNLKGTTRDAFDATLKTRLILSFPRLRRLDIEHVDSTSNVNIQIADFIAGAIFQKHERGDCSFYDMIRPRIVQEQALFRA